MPFSPSFSLLSLNNYPITYSSFRHFLKVKSLDLNQATGNNDVDCHRGNNFLSAMKAFDCEIRVAVI